MPCGSLLNKDNWKLGTFQGTGGGVPERVNLFQKKRRAVRGVGTGWGEKDQGKKKRRVRV